MSKYNYANLLCLGRPLKIPLCGVSSSSTDAALAERSIFNFLIELAISSSRSSSRERVSLVSLRLRSIDPSRSLENGDVRRDSAKSSSSRMRLLNEGALNAGVVNVPGGKEVGDEYLRSN